MLIIFTRCSHNPRYCLYCIKQNRKGLCYSMKQIIYVSKKQAEVSQLDIESIVEQAQQFNRTVDVTGALLSVGDYFYQLLEGKESKLDELMKKIDLDSRHKEVKIVFQSDIDARDFSTWSMKFVDLSAKQDVPEMLLRIAQMSSIKPEMAIGLKFMMKGEVDL